MTKMKLLAVAATMGLVASAGVAWAAGMLTNGVPTVCAPTQNGANATTVPASGTGSGTAPSMNCSQTQVSGSWVGPVDTNLTGGTPPQTVQLSLAQMGAIAAQEAANVATSTAGAATLNTRAGTITTESLSTAVGATYTFTLTNSLITATGAVPMVQLVSKTNTGGQGSPIGGPMTLTSVTNAAGSTVIVFTNNGTAALNGTMVLVFWLGN